MKSIILVIFTMVFLAPKTNQEISSTRIYSSKKCTYTVYKAKAGGTVRCENLIKVGVVSPGNKVIVEAKKGEPLAIFINYGYNKPCGTSKLRTTLSVGPLQRKSSILQEELYDNSCQ